MASNNNRNISEEFRLFLKANPDLPKFTVYGLATASVCAAVYRSKKFSKFVKPLDVPTNFIKKHVPLHGVVMRVEPSSGTLLMVNHKPFIALPRLNKERYLPIQLAGIDVQPNGVSWLQTVVSGKEITFIPLNRQKEFVDCIVLMSQENEKEINIGEEITRLGFATVRGISSEVMYSKRISTYQKSLYAAEKQAKFKRNGYWHFTIPPSILWKFQMSFENILSSFAAK